MWAAVRCSLDTQFFHPPRAIDEHPLPEKCKIAACYLAGDKIIFVMKGSYLLTSLPPTFTIYMVQCSLYSIFP